MRSFLHGLVYGSGAADTVESLQLEIRTRDLLEAPRAYLHHAAYIARGMSTDVSIRVRYLAVVDAPTGTNIGAEFTGSPLEIICEIARFNTVSEIDQDNADLRWFCDVMYGSVFGNEFGAFHACIEAMIPTQRTMRCSAILEDILKVARERFATSVAYYTVERPSTVREYNNIIHKIEVIAAMLRVEQPLPT